MGADRQALLEQVLALPAEERAGFVADILASLPAPDSGYSLDSADWVGETARRARRVLDGDSTADDWDVAEQRVWSRLSNE